MFRHEPTPQSPTFGGPIVVTESYNIKGGHEESVRQHSSNEENVHIRTVYRRPASSIDEDNLVEVLAVTPGSPIGSVDIEQAIVYNLGESSPTSTIVPAQQASTVIPSTKGYTGTTWTKAVTGVVGVSGPPRTTGTDFTSTVTVSPGGVTAAGSTWTSGTGSSGATLVGSTWPGTTVTTEGTTVLATSTKGPSGVTNSWSTGFTGRATGTASTATASTVTVSTVTADPEGTTSPNQETRGMLKKALFLSRLRESDQRDDCR